MIINILITIDKNLTLAPRPRGGSLITAILISFPVRQYIANSRTIRQFVYLLEVLFADVEWLCRDVGDVLPDQLARIDRRPVDLLQQERSERLHP